MMEDSNLNVGDNLYPELDAEEVLAEEEEDELENELKKIEDEIATLKQVLTAKEQRAVELRKLLGYTPMNQLKAELNKIQSSQPFVKTSETLKSAGQATASVFSSFGSSINTKFSDMKNSNTFKSFEEKMEGMSSSFMAKVGGAMGQQDKIDGLDNGDLNSSDKQQAVIQQQPTTVTTTDLLGDNVTQ